MDLARLPCPLVPEPPSPEQTRERQSACPSVRPQDAKPPHTAPPGSVACLSFPLLVSGAHDPNGTPWAAPPRTALDCIPYPSRLWQRFPWTPPRALRTGGVRSRRHSTPLLGRPKSSIFHLSTRLLRRGSLHPAHAALRSPARGLGNAKEDLACQLISFSFAGSLFDGAGTAVATADARNRDGAAAMPSESATVPRVRCIGVRSSAPLLLTSVRRSDSASPSRPSKDAEVSPTPRHS